ESPLKGWVDELAASVDRPVLDADVRLSGAVPSIVPGQLGRTTDRSRLVESIRAAILAGGPSTLPLPYSDVPQRRTPQQLEPAAAKLRTAFGSTPLKLQYEGKSWQVPAETIGPMLSWKLSPAPSAEIEVSLDQAKLRPQIERLAKEVRQTGRDATLA